MFLFFSFLVLALLKEMYKKHASPQLSGAIEWLNLVPKVLWEHSSLMT